MAELRVFHNHRFLCRAICAELAGGTIALREIIQARTHRRQALRHTLQDRARTVEALFAAHRGDHAVEWFPPPIPEEALPPDALGPPRPADQAPIYPDTPSWRQAEAARPARRTQRLGQYA